MGAMITLKPKHCLSLLSLEKQQLSFMRLAETKTAIDSIFPRRHHSSGNCSFSQTRNARAVAGGK